MTYNIQDFHRRFRTNEQCLEYLFELQYTSAECPKCHRTGAYHKHPTKQCYTCNCGQSHLYPKKGTIFEASPIPLTKWLYALYLFCQSRAGVSAKELERRLQVTYPTAWRMSKKIRAVVPPEGLWGEQSFFDAALRNCILDAKQREKIASAK